MYHHAFKHPFPHRCSLEILQAEPRLSVSLLSVQCLLQLSPQKLARSQSFTSFSSEDKSLRLYNVRARHMMFDQMWLGFHRHVRFFAAQTGLFRT